MITNVALFYRFLNMFKNRYMYCYKTVYRTNKINRLKKEEFLNSKL